MTYAEEFGIYLNYVRKLGFEENPDYDFLRDLLSKVLRNSGEVRFSSHTIWHAVLIPSYLLG